MTFLDFVYYTFIFVVFFQVLLYIFFYGRFAFLKQNKESQKSIPISVIICAKNEAKNLTRFLPSIIEQDYSNFEIVLINDASNDDTLQVMEAFASKQDNIKIVNVKNNEAFWGNKKYALTLGIKAAKNDYFLFTDADCKPVSNQWISEMSSHFNSKKAIVLGYGKYAKTDKSFLNKLIRFETVITAVQYFTFTKFGLPYMGVGRNLAYKKDTFFKANGFINHIKIRSGDDDLFINQVATKDNTTICISENSFTESVPKTTFNQWITQKRRHISTANHYKKTHKFLLALLYTFQFLFWSLALILLLAKYQWIVVFSLLLVKIIVQYIIIGLSAKKLGEKDFLFLIPFLELFLIATHLIIFIKNCISKPNHWK
ncbi:glycosyl transferase family 2 [Pseudalgibacter alginicilyticus]|uniref:Glycosyl transferase family 2 n=1 Tax=Pseudalgibacter alginicilyticus TaxID=1736674 RepID=A0A0P0CJD3_9FLAO|nr:glycosyltransferase [Pseudalgibacter alginicilyticus]ALJ06315.1 glycosyl transferase family 2 [Pseudalgibacter alginicilyticus]